MNLSNESHGNNPYHGSDFLLFRHNDTEVRVDFVKVQRAYKLLQILNHPVRQRILVILEAQPGLSVTELYKALGLEQSHMSQHLGKLKKLGLVRTLRKGRFTGYRVDAERCSKLYEYVVMISNA